MKITKLYTSDKESCKFNEFKKQIGNLNPITNSILPEIYDIINGRYFYRFFLSDFIEKTGKKNTPYYSFYYASEWDFAVSDDGKKLAKQLIDLNIFDVDEHTEKSLFLLFSFGIHVWVHISDLIFNKKDKIIFSGVNLINRIAQAKYGLKCNDLILDINNTIDLNSYSYLGNLLNYKINYNELNIEEFNDQKVVYKIPDLSLFSSKKHMPYEKIVEVYEKNNIVLYQSLYEDDVIIQGIYRLKKFKKFSLVMQKEDRISSLEAEKFKSIIYV